MALQVMRPLRAGTLPCRRMNTAFGTTLASSAARLNRRQVEPIRILDPEKPQEAAIIHRGALLAA